MWACTLPLWSLILTASLSHCKTVWSNFIPIRSPLKLFLKQCSILSLIFWTLGNNSMTTNHKQFLVGHEERAQQISSLDMRNQQWCCIGVTTEPISTTPLSTHHQGKLCSCPWWSSNSPWEIDGAFSKTSKLMHFWCTLWVSKMIRGVNPTMPSQRCSRQGLLTNGMRCLDILLAQLKYH